MNPYGPLEAFHHVVVAVDDPEAAAADWSRLFGAARSDGSRIDLGESWVDFVAGDGGRGGVSKVAVVVDDAGPIVDDAVRAGLSVHRRGDHPMLEISGVRVELRADRPPPGNGPRSPLRRIHHVVVAVRDEAAALALWRKAFRFSPAPEGPDGLLLEHHVPVGDAWFGVTGTGTDAGALERFVGRRGEGMYALALVVDDRAACAAAVAAGGGRVIGEPTDAQIFVHPASTHGVLVELADEWPGGIRRPRR